MLLYRVDVYLLEGTGNLNTHRILVKSYRIVSLQICQAENQVVFVNKFVQI